MSGSDLPLSQHQGSREDSQLRGDQSGRASLDFGISRRQFVMAAGAMAIAGCSRRPSNTGPIHVVEDGDTLSSVAAAYGIGVGELINHNHLRQRDLRIGQRLQLPAHARRVPAPTAAADGAVIRSGTAGGVGGMSALITRRQWGAPEPGSNWDLMGPVRHITLHHTDEYPGMRGLPDEIVVQNICRYHRRLGWADIGYHYLVGRDGKVYEGRRVDRQGAHSGGDNNRNNLGISLIGNFERQLPDTLQLSSTQQLLSQQLGHYRLARKALRGHREWSPTICPGDALFAWMVAFREGRLPA